jgi:putative FmdB family regulatory protein
MPIYAYKCESCGHRQDVLQKISDPVLTVCTACGASAFAKQVTAAGFQLKGSGWYVTDFRGGSGAAAPAAAAPAGDAAAKKTDGGSSGGGSSEGGSSSSGGSPAPSGGGESSSSAAAGGCGASCACH